MPTYFNSTYTLLDQYAIERRNKPGMLIGQKVAPLVPVDIDSKKYPVFGEEFLIDSPGQGIRPPSAEAESVDFTYSLDSYKTVERAYQTKLDDRERDNAQPEFRVEQQKTYLVTDKQLLRHEMACAAAVFNATTFTSYYAALSGTDRWDNASSDPRVQVAIAKASIRDNGVVDPEQVSLIVGSDTFIALQKNAAILKSLNYTMPYAPSADIIAKILGVKEILVGSGVKKVAGTKSQIWGKYAMFAYIQEAQNLEDVSFAKTFVRREKDMRIDSWYDQKLSSTFWRSKWDYDLKITATSSGYLFGTVIS